MKKTILFLLFSLSLMFVKSQCINVNTAYFTNPSGDNLRWSLNINWTSESSNHLVTYVMSGSDTVFTTCLQVSGQGSGTSVYNDIIAPGGLPTLSASFCRWTGPCGGGVKCGPDQIIPPGDVLDIKIQNISARYVDMNTTEVKFTVGSIFGSKEVTLNLRMKSGIVKKYKVQMPSFAKSGETWSVTINHIDGKYKIVKL